MKWALVPTLAAVMAVLTSACAGASDPSAGGAQVVVSTGLLADVVDSVACGEIDVVALVPPGADLHTYEPSLRDRARLRDAALVVQAGPADPPALGDLLAEAEAPRIRIEPETGTGDSTHPWLDPWWVHRAVPTLADGLVEHAGADAAAVAVCAETYQAQLAAVDAEVVALVETVPDENRQLVATHDVLASFAERYGFRVLATVSEDPHGLVEPSLARLDELAQLIRDEGVRTVFSDAEEGDALADALAARVDGVAVVGIPAHPPEGSGYADLLRTVTDLVVEGTR